jgi:hypothetical protein
MLSDEAQLDVNDIYALPPPSWLGLMASFMMELFRLLLLFAVIVKYVLKYLRGTEQESPFKVAHLSTCAFV